MDSSNSMDMCGVAGWFGFDVRVHVRVIGCNGCLFYCAPTLVHHLKSVSFICKSSPSNEGGE